MRIGRQEEDTVKSGSVYRTECGTQKGSAQSACKAENAAGRAAEERFQIRRLQGRECLDLRPLWEEVFCEDTRLFTDYYFREKADKNTAFVLEKAGAVQSMLYLTPYRMVIGRIDDPAQAGACLETSYIVGVATRKEWRHRGFMSRLLKQSCRWMREKGQPFAFLMPADPAIYTPFGFRYLYEKSVRKLRPEIRERLEACFTEPGAASGPQGGERLRVASREYATAERDALTLRRMEPSDAPDVAAFASRILRERYQLYTERTADYYLLQQKEMIAQRGNLFLLFENRELVGCLLYGREEGGEIQDAVLGPGLEERVFLQNQETAPAIMGRIIHLERMLSYLRSSRSFRLRLLVRDGLLEENDGFFCWECGPAVSYVTREPDSRTVCGMERDGEAVLAGETPGVARESGLAGEAPGAARAQDGYLETSIDSLTEFLFGRKDAKDCFTIHGIEPGEALPPQAAPVWESLRGLRVWKHICINEIV